MKDAFRSSVLMLISMTLLTGVVYPLAVSGVAWVAFPRQAGGSLIVRNGQTVGSELIGQPFTDPGRFWGRPSATTGVEYNAAASGGSNLGPLNPALRAIASARIEALNQQGPVAGPIPADLVTASGSGLDPHISPASADVQVGRVAKARGIPEDELRRLVVQHTEGRQFGLLGEPRVNVLMLNLAIDELRR